MSHLIWIAVPHKRLIKNSIRRSENFHRRSNFNFSKSATWKLLKASCQLPAQIDSKFRVRNFCHAKRFFFIDFQKQNDEKVSFSFVSSRSLNLFCVFRDYCIQANFNNFDFNFSLEWKWLNLLLEYMKRVSCFLFNISNLANWRISFLNYSRPRLIWLITLLFYEHLM